MTETRIQNPQTKIQFCFSDVPERPLSYGKEPGQSRSPSADQPQARKPNKKTRRVNAPQTFQSARHPVVERQPWEEK